MLPERRRGGEEQPVGGRLAFGGGLLQVQQNEGLGEPLSLLAAEAQHPAEFVLVTCKGRGCGFQDMAIFGVS